jgi:hypothetical protein
VLIGAMLLAWVGPSMAAVHGPLGVQAPGARASSTAAKAADNKPAKLIDINSASRNELKTLPGIGDAEADKIIAGRPYLSKTHLVSDAGIPAGIYQSIRHRVIAIQNKAARAKLEAAAKAASKSQVTAPKAR